MAGLLVMPNTLARAQGMVIALGRYWTATLVTCLCLALGGCSRPVPPAPPTSSATDPLAVADDLFGNRLAGVSRKPGNSTTLVIALRDSEAPTESEVFTLLSAVREASGASETCELEIERSHSAYGITSVYTWNARERTVTWEEQSSGGSNVTTQRKGMLSDTDTHMISAIANGDAPDWQPW